MKIDWIAFWAAFSEYRRNLAAQQERLDGVVVKSLKSDIEPSIWAVLKSGGY